MMPESLNPNLYSALKKEEPGFSDYDLQDMSDVATYISWAQYHGIELNIEVTDEQSKWCYAASDQFLYEWFEASDDYWKLSSNQLLKLIDEVIEISAFGADPSDSKF